MPFSLPITRAIALVLLLCSSALGGDAAPEPPAQSGPSQTDQLLADTLATIVRESIPREYQRKKDWGQQKRITTGVKADGPFYKLKLHRRKTEVDHGTWKRYRVWFVEPEKALHVRVADLHSLEGGGVGLRLIVDADLEGWAQLRHYNRGLHLLTLTAEGSSQLRLTIDCQVRMKMTARGMTILPVVTNAKLDLRDFELTRFGEVEGKLARELGRGMKHLMEDQLDGPKLTAKLNRAIHKKRDRLVLFGSP